MIYKKGQGFFPQTKIEPVSTVYLRVQKMPNGEYHISNGRSESFIKDKTVVISDKNPNLLWSLCHELIGLPIPSQTFNDQLEKLNRMTAKEIVAKIKREKGIELDLSLKSKAAIIKSFLEIYK